MTKFADLHIHTFYSDSTSSPQEVVSDAVKAGLNCIAITDHDTLEGVGPTREAAKAHNLEVLAGVELSSQFEGKDIHILGYLVDDRKGPLKELLLQMQDSRVERIRRMLDRLKTFGIDNIALEEVCALTHSKSVGRPHLAEILVQKGWVSSIKEAFDKYLAEGAAAYEGKYKISPGEAIDLIRQSGGISVLAHPMLTQVDHLLPRFVDAGLGGIEVYYPNCSDSIIKFYERIAQKHNLILTGGSDAHGEAKKHTCVGKQRIPYALVEILKTAKISV